MEGFVKTTGISGILIPLAGKRSEGSELSSRAESRLFKETIKGLFIHLMKRFKILYVYMLSCSDGTYYTGVTNDLERRLIEHKCGYNKNSYTYTRRPLQLIYYEMFNDFNSAIEWETKIKKWSAKKKQALAASDWKKLKEASECKNETSHKLYNDKLLCDRSRLRST
jgi:putative endonuclease